MKRRPALVALVLLIFFVISFLTNILGALNPSIKSSFNLELSSLGFMTMAFFSAYALMSIPAGILVERWKEKKTMIFAFTLAGSGSVAFVLFPDFSTFLFSLFLIGAGMAILQVAINPLLRTSGGEEHFAFYSVLGQLCFGLAGFMGPYFFSFLMDPTEIQSPFGAIRILLYSWAPHQMPWASLYVVFAIITLIIITVLTCIRFPKTVLNSEERISDLKDIVWIIKAPRTIGFFVGIFCYVGFEQGVSFWLSQFLEKYHGIDPNTNGAETVGNFWGCLTLGCLLGLALLKVMDSKVVLVLFSLLAGLSLVLALLGPAPVALMAFPAVGFFASVMWSIIVSLALNSVRTHHGALTGILCTGIAGGAIAPLLIGALSEVLSLRTAMFLNFCLLSYIMSVGFWARPLVGNKLYKRRQTV
ncbi:MFS transporter [Chryseolinea sp. Jin1]|uniref:MFS transporter n=2 Tax=Chryseolinea lacunae TaxID=2801331 RepID=A0ABS1L2L2_9BACT|nr:MFS transporter [Chryseolinea lacunae]